MSVCVYICYYVCTFICLCVYMYICMCLVMFVKMYVRMYVSMHVCFIHVYTRRLVLVMPLATGVANALNCSLHCNYVFYYFVAKSDCLFCFP